MKQYLLGVAFLVCACPQIEASGSTQILIRAECISVPRKVLDRIARKTPRASVDVQALFRLKQAGDARVAFAPQLILQPDTEGVLQATQDVTYPHSLDVETVTVTNMVRNTLVATVVTPSNIATWEVGKLLSARAKIRHEGKHIEVTVQMDLSSLPEWKYHEGKYVDSCGHAETLQLPQPFVYRVTLGGTVVIRDGAIVLVGGGAPDIHNREISYLLVTARLIDAAGQPINETVEPEN